MGQLSYEQYENQKQQNTTSGPRIGYFSLKNNKDEAVVRFMHSSPADFDINLVHRMNVDGRTRNVNCIRELNQSAEACPACAAGIPLKKTIYIHLLEYVKQEDGSFKAVPKFWERSSAYITTMANLCNEYGDLSEYLFKIKRNGEAGSVDTTYDIMFASPAIYRNDIYTKDPEAFKDITALGKAIVNKSFNELDRLVNPATASAEPERVEQASQNTYTPASTASYDQPQPARTYTPTEVFGDEEPFARPRRLYDSNN